MINQSVYPIRKKIVLLNFFIFLIGCKLFAQDWKKLNTISYPGKQDDIFFIDQNKGWYVNGFGKIYHTKDGGNNWQLIHEKKGTFFRCIAFVDSLIGFVGNVGTDYFPGVTDTIPLYKTVDGGYTWAAVNYKGPSVKGLCALDVVKEPFINHGQLGYKNHIFGVGRVGGPAAFMESHDNGNSFTSSSINPIAAAMFDIRMLNLKEGFACASSSENLEESHALILRTKDGGKTWKRVYQSKRPMELTWKLSFPDKQTGFATIQHYSPDTSNKTQRIVVSRNGGKSWREIKLCTHYGSRPFGIGFIDRNTGYVGTMNSGYKTTDSGKTWTKTELGKACNKIRILHLPNGGIRAFAIGVSVFRLDIPIQD